LDSIFVQTHSLINPNYYCHCSCNSAAFSLLRSGEADQVVAYCVLRERAETEAAVRQDLLQPSLSRLSRLSRQTTAQRMQLQQNGQPAAFSRLHPLIFLICGQRVKCGLPIYGSDDCTIGYNADVDADPITLTLTLTPILHIT